MNPGLKKAAPLILVLLLGALLFILKKCSAGRDPVPNPSVKTDDKRDPASNPDRDRGFDRRVSYLQYSKHAKCRMDCRHITQAEVEDVMRNGKINYNKSDIQNARCPRYALEAVTKDNQDVRIIFAQCNESTTVVTVIDLDNNWTCDCPGDDRKYENKNQ